MLRCAVWRLRDVSPARSSGAFALAQGIVSAVYIGPRACEVMACFV